MRICHLNSIMFFANSRMCFSLLRLQQNSNFLQLQSPCRPTFILLLLTGLILTQQASTISNDRQQAATKFVSRQHTSQILEIQDSETTRSQRTNNLTTNKQVLRLVKRDASSADFGNFQNSQPDAVSSSSDDEQPENSSSEGYANEENNYGNSATGGSDEANSTMYAPSDYEAEIAGQDDAQPNSQPLRPVSSNSGAQAILRPSRQSIGGHNTMAPSSRPSGDFADRRQPLAVQTLNSAQPTSSSFDPTMRTQRPKNIANDSIGSHTMIGQANNFNNNNLRNRQQPTTSSATNLAMAPQETHSPTFNGVSVNMGPDSMLIKPYQQQTQHQHQHQFPHQHQRQRQAPTTPIMAASVPTTTASTTLASGSSLMAADQEMATESVNHELLSNIAGSATMSPNSLNERRQDLLYPSNNLDDTNLAGVRQPINSLVTPVNQFMDEQQAAQMSVPSICYTPIALLMVILITIMITIVFCFCTHVLIKHLGRRQFDLIESSKQFETKHESGYLQGAAERRAKMLAPDIGVSNSDLVRSASDSKHSVAYMLGMFQDTRAHPNGTSKSMQRYRDEHGCAFDNPYFRDEYKREPQPQPGSSDNILMDHRVTDDAGRLLSASISNSGVHNRPNLTQLPDNEQLHFIEHHISNLHNRQVTSSVKELSILGLPDLSGSQTSTVVDLTSAEQRARVIADPKEGDLVAVDITGHDFIGLGFDVCGNSHDGIFIRSVLARGPARESGCIEPGDRIKCLNISFDNVTLQDAYDILNCGAPYKLRLLLEKRATSSKLPERILRSSAPLIPRQGCSSHPLTANNYQRQQCQRQLMPQELSQTRGGPISVTKTYIKRLTHLVSPSVGKSTSGATFVHDNHPTFNSHNSVFKNSEHQLLESVPHYLGSRAARRQHTLDGAHVNAGYGSETDEVEDELASRAARHRYPSRADSIGSRSRGRFSADSSTEAFGSSANDFRQDTSLDYSNRNANHRLHGPPMALSQQASRGAMDLHLASNHDQADVKLGETDSHRRKSVASSCMPLNGHSHKVDQHLEQTQSQPEIAGVDDIRSTIDENPTGGKNTINSIVGRAQLMSSISTPTMNLLTNSNQTDWRQAKGDRKECIREEAASESSSTEGTLTQANKSTTGDTPRESESTGDRYIDNTLTNTSNITKDSTVVASDIHTNNTSNKQDVKPEISDRFTQQTGVD